MVLGACGGAGLDTSSVPEPGSGGAQAEDVAPAPPGAGDTDTGGTQDPGNAAEVPDRQIARTADVTIRVEDAAAAAEAARGIAEESGSLVTHEDVRQEEGTRTSASLELAVPADKLDATLDELSGLGEQVSREVSSEDVTGEVVDTEARIRTMRSSIARLQDLMEQAEDINDITSLESELTSRQSDLEALLAKQQSLAEQVARSEVDVLFVTTRAEAAPERDGFFGGLAAGWAGLVALTITLLNLVGTLLPFAVVAAIIAVPIMAWRRRVRRNRPAAAVPTQPGAQGRSRRSPWRRSRASRTDPAPTPNSARSAAAGDRDSSPGSPTAPPAAPDGAPGPGPQDGPNGNDSTTS